MLAIYTRISKDRPNQVSTEVQKQQGIKCAKNIALPYELYEEERGTSGGKKINERDELQRLQNDVEFGKITAIFVYDQDRAERDELTWFTILDLMEEYNIKFYENGILQDMDDENTRMLSGFKSVMNASFKRKTAKKIRAAKLKNAKDGKKVNATIKYGYTSDKNGYIILDESEDDKLGKKGRLGEADVVRDIFDKSLNGWGTLKIAHYLNDNNIPTRYNKLKKGTLTITNKQSGRIITKNKTDVKWQQNTVRQIIKSTWYIGKRIYTDKTVKPYKKITIKIPALFTEDYWQKVNDNLSANRTHSGKPVNKWLVKGVLRCVCSDNMYGVHNEEKRENYYKCASTRRTNTCGHRSINRPFIENFIWKVFFKDEYLATLVHKHFDDTNAEEMLETLDKKLKTLQSTVTSLNNEKKTIIRLITKNTITESEGEVELKRIRQDLNDVNIDIKNTNNQIKTYQNLNTSKDTMVSQLINIKNTSNFNDMKSIIKTYIKDVIVDDKHIGHKGRIRKDDLYHITVVFNIPNVETKRFLASPVRGFAFTEDGDIITAFKENILAGINRDLNTKLYCESELEKFMKEQQKKGLIIKKQARRKYIFK